MTDQPKDLQLAWWAKKFDDIDRELAQLATICKVPLLDPGVIERVLKNDASVCGAPNPTVFGEAALAADDALRRARQGGRGARGDGRRRP